MKKLILSLSVAVLVATPVFSQKYSVGALEFKIEKSNKIIANPKKASKSSTWLTRGTTFVSIATANSSGIFVGMSEIILIQTVGKPLNESSIPIEKIGDIEYKKLEYATVDIYVSVENPQISMWVEKTKVEPKAVELALEAFDKAVELDPDKAKEKASAGYKEIVSYISTNGNNLYTLGKYKEAAELFKQAADIDSKNPVAPSADPDEMLYYAAVSSVLGEDYEFAAPIFEELIEKGVGKDGDTYFYAGIVYEKLENKEKAKECLQEGVEKHLENKRLLQQFITFSIQNNEGAEAVLPYIIKAQEKDPENPIFYIAEGIVYDQEKEYDKAIAVYNKALVFDADNFNILYNLGFAYRSKAIEINNELSKVDYTNTKLIEELKGNFKAAMIGAITPFESAHKIKPEDKLIVEVLRSIFFSLRDEDPAMLENYNKFDTLYKSM